MVVLVVFESEKRPGFEPNGRCSERGLQAVRVTRTKILKRNEVGEVTEELKTKVTQHLVEEDDMYMICREKGTETVISFD